MIKKLSKNDINDLVESINSITDELNSGTSELSDALMPYFAEIDGVLDTKELSKATYYLVDAKQTNDKPEYIKRALRMLDKGLRDTHVNRLTALFLYNSDIY